MLANESQCNDNDIESGTTTITPAHVIPRESKQPDDAEKNPRDDDDAIMVWWKKWLLLLFLLTTFCLMMYAGVSLGKHLLGKGKKGKNDNVQEIETVQGEKVQFSASALKSGDVNLSDQEGFSISFDIWNGFDFVNVKSVGEVGFSKEMTLVNQGFGDIVLDGSVVLDFDNFEGLKTMFDQINDGTALSQAFESAKGSAVSSAFSGEARLELGLEKLTNGALGDIVTKLGSANVYHVFKSSPQERNVAKGFYVLAKNAELDLLQSLLLMLEPIIDKTVGEGVSKTFLSHINGGDGAGTEVGVAIVDDFVGVHVKVGVDDIVKSIPPFKSIPLSDDFLGNLVLECKFQKQAKEFGCVVDYIKPQGFNAIVEDVKDEVMWVVRKVDEKLRPVGDAVQFFDEKFRGGCANKEGFGKVCTLFTEDIAAKSKDIFDKILDELESIGDGIKDGFCSLFGC
jgi:hypothetical protein